jgi:hypothetical protein
MLKRVWKERSEWWNGQEIITFILRWLSNL